MKTPRALVATLALVAVTLAAAGALYAFADDDHSQPARAVYDEPGPKSPGFDADGTFFEPLEPEGYVYREEAVRAPTDERRLPAAAPAEDATPWTTPKTQEKVPVLDYPPTEYETDEEFEPSPSQGCEDAAPGVPTCGVEDTVEDAAQEPIPVDPVTLIPDEDPSSAVPSEEPPAEAPPVPAPEEPAEPEVPAEAYEAAAAALGAAEDATGPVSPL